MTSKPDDDKEMTDLAKALIALLGKVEGFDPSAVLQLGDSPTLGETINALYAARRTMQNGFGDRARKAHNIIGDDLLGWTFKGLSDTGQQVEQETGADAVLYAINELCCLPAPFQAWAGEAALKTFGHAPQDADIPPYAAAAYWQQTLCSQFFKHGYQMGRKAQQEIDLLNRTMGGMK